jgi:hypothetical protein
MTDREPDQPDGEPDARDTGAAEDQPLPGPPASPDPEDEPDSSDSSPFPDGV